MVQILAAVAENERDMISERTKAALARAKANGTRLGAPDPVANLAAVVYGRSAAAEEFRAQIRPRIQEMRTARATFQHIADTLNREHFPTPSGKGTWSAATVYKALETPNGLTLDGSSPAGDVKTANDDTLPLFASLQEAEASV
jgi:DNA invertase Pin-like site-specific DNA recombinase